MARAKGYFTTRVDPLTSLFLVIPLFLIYQIGLLVQMDCQNGQCRWVGNGADFLTGNMLAATHGSRAVYAGIALGTAAALTAGVLWARRRAKLSPRMFVPVLIESAIYASLVSPLINRLQHALTMGAPGQSNFLGDIVASCGAGLNEELIFRVVGFGGLAFLLTKLKVPRLWAVLAAVIVSSLVFSAVHHLGAMGDRFTFGVFFFRFLAGVLFATVYATRGFAMAAWTHAIYDIWVFAMQRMH